MSTLAQLQPGQVIPLNTPVKTASKSQKSAPVPALATAVQRETAIAALRTSVDTQIEWLQTIVDGASIAVIQTQDITALSQTVKVANSKTVTVSDLLCDAILYLALQALAGPVKGALQSYAEETAESFLQTNTAFKLLPLSEQGKELTGDAIQQALSDLGQPSADGKKWLIYSDSVRTAVLSSSDKVVGMLMGAAMPKPGGGGDSGGPSIGAKQTVPATDQPRTAITRSVLSYVAMHRLAMRIQENNLEAVLRTAPFTADQLTQLTSALTLQAPPDTLDSLRNKYALLVESCIWGKLFNLDTPGAWIDRIYANGQTDSGDPSLPGGGNMRKVPSLIVQYWWTRFSGFGDVPQNGTGLNQSIQVCKMFETVGGQLDDAIQALGSDAVIQVSGP